VGVVGRAPAIEVNGDRRGSGCRKKQQQQKCCDDDASNHVQQYSYVYSYYEYTISKVQLGAARTDRVVFAELFTFAATDRTISIDLDLTFTEIAVADTIIFIHAGWLFQGDRQ